MKNIKVPKFIQKMNNETKVVILMVVAIFIFVWLMPKIYITLKEGIHFPSSGNNSNNSSTNNNNQNHTTVKEVTITCSGTIKDEYTETENKVILYAKNNKLQKQENYLTMKALTEEGKDIVESQKIFQDEMIEAYKKYNGFTVNSSYKNDTYQFHLISDYTNLDVGRINTDYETTGSIYLEFKLNQDIETVQKYFVEYQGLTCK